MQPETLCCDPKLRTTNATRGTKKEQRKEKEKENEKETRIVPEKGTETEPGPEHFQVQPQRFAGGTRCCGLVYARFGLLSRLLPT